MRQLSAAGMRVAVFSLAALSMGAGCQSAEPDAPKDPAPAPTTTTSVGLDAKVECSKVVMRTGVAQLSWPANKREEQRIEMTHLAAGFSMNQFESSPPLPAGQSSYTWENLHGQAVHFWRVSTLKGGTWVPGNEVGKFEGPSCPFDGE